MVGGVPPRVHRRRPARAPPARVARKRGRHEVALRVSKPDQTAQPEQTANDVQRVPQNVLQQAHAFQLLLKVERTPQHGAPDHGQPRQHAERTPPARPAAVDHEALSALAALQLGKVLRVGRRAQHRAAARAAVQRLA